MLQLLSELSLLSFFIDLSAPVVDVRRNTGSDLFGIVGEILRSVPYKGKQSLIWTLGTNMTKNVNGQS